MAGSAPIDRDVPTIPLPPAGLRLRDDDGVSLTEVLVVTVVMVVIVLGVLQTLDSAARTVPRDVERTHAIAEGRVGVVRMVRELRGAETIRGTTPNSVDFETSADGVVRRVRFACEVPDDALAGFRRCTRVEAVAGGELPAPSTGETLVARVRNGTAADPVFAGVPDAVSPRYLRVRVLVPSTGRRTAHDRPGHDVVLEDGAYLRNRDLGG